MPARMTQASALDYFELLRDLLRPKPGLHPAGDVAAPTSLAAARAELPKHVYAAALLMATAHRLQGATLALARDSSQGHMHAFAIQQVALPLWRQYTASLAAAITRYEREWHGRPHPLFLLNTPAFAAGGAPPWEETRQELTTAGIPLDDRTAVRNPATAELDNLGIDTAQLVAQHINFMKQLEHGSKYDDHRKAEILITKWESEDVVLAAVHAHRKDPELGVEALVPQVASRPLVKKAALAFLEAAHALHEALAEPSATTLPQADARLAYSVAAAILEEVAGG